MANHKTSFFESYGWRKGMALLYGLGAAVVILGALFKILHLPGANEMLIVGMGVETAIFAVSAFEPIPTELPKHYEWEKVYPSLLSEVEEGVDGSELPPVGTPVKVDTTAASGLNESLKAINQHFSPEIFESLSLSIKGLNSNVTNLSELADAANATNDYSKKVKEAAGKLDEMNKSYSSTLEAMTSFSNSINDVKAYQEQVQGITKNLSSLNAVYELELQDAQNHLKSINKFYGSLANVMNNLVDTSKETETLRQEVTTLATNMGALNRIYGAMINAMATAGKQ